MAIKEQDKVFYEELANGDKVINLPVTRANNVEGLGRSANTAYAVGDVVYTDNNNKVALKCITAGTTSNTELDISGNNIGDTVTDGTVVWQVCNRTSDVTSVNGKTGDVIIDLPVGHMYWSVEPNVPAGRLPALGATYNRALYADLWAWANSVGLVKTESEWQAIASANDGNCAYYSDGDGSSTFRVPKLPNTIVTDASDGEIPVYGNGLTLGLTSGSGEYGVSAVGGNYPNMHLHSDIGARVGASVSMTTGQTNVAYGITTDATESGIVAKTSATKITGQWLIVAFGIAHNVGEANVENVMQAVEQVQTGLGKVDGIVDYIVESYRNGTEWYDVYRSGKVRQGGYASVNSTISVITLLREMATMNYGAKGSIGARVAWSIQRSSTTQIELRTDSTTSYGMTWEVEGQGA